MRDLYNRLVEDGLGDSYEAAHARLAADYIATIYERRRLQSEGKLHKLAEASQTAADRSYVDTAVKLCDGFWSVIESYSESDDPEKKHIYQLCTEHAE